MLRTALTALVVGLVVTSAPVQAQGPSAPSNIVDVELVDVSSTQFAFSPAKITVKRGDVIRFTQTRVNAHNIEFKGFPAGVDLGDIRVGPYMMTPGQVYEVKVDARFAPGTYDYVCTPHESMGMKGQIVVVP